MASTPSQVDTFNQYRKNLLCSSVTGFCYYVNPGPQFTLKSDYYGCAERWQQAEFHSQLQEK